MKSSFRYLLCCALLVASHSSIAQVGFNPNAEGFTQNQPNVAPPVPGQKLAVPESQGLSILPELETIELEIVDIKVLGVSQYSDATIAAMAQPLIDQRNIKLADIYRLANKITLKYRNDGFILSRAFIPGQEIDTSGMVTLQVVEGYIDEVTARVAPNTADRTVSVADKTIAAVLARVAHLEGIRPLRVQDLERALLLVRDLGGLDARPIIRPSLTTPGASALVLLVDQKKFSSQVSVANYDTKFTGKEIGSTSATYHDSRGDKWTLSYQQSFPDSFLTSWATSVDVPLHENGLAFHIRYSRSQSNPGFELAPAEIDSLTTQGIYSIDYPLIRARDKNLRIGAGIRVQKSRVNVLGTRQTVDRIRLPFVSLNYDWFDSWGGASAVSLQINKSNGFGSHTDGSDAFASRPEASDRYTTYQASVVRLQNLGYPRLNALIAVSTQYTNTPLLSGLEFFGGGEQFGRGYDPGEISGDRGVAAKVELQYGGFGVEWGQLENPVAYAFWDSANVENLDDALQGTPLEQLSLDSAGLGLKFNWARQTTWKIEIAKALSRVPQAEAGASNPDDIRIYLTGSMRF